MSEPQQYGNWIVGIWLCEKCHYNCFPRKLSEENAQAPFECPECQSELVYDEAE
jgi:ribosomal protein L37AE/L43A